MTPAVLGLIASAAFVHAVWNLAIKKAGASGATFLWLAFLVGAVVFLPFGVASIVQAQVDLWVWLGFASVSGAFQVGYFLLLQKGYRVGDVSVVYPLARGTGPLLSVIFAMIFFGERPSALALIGVAVVVCGVLIIGLAGGLRRGANSRIGVFFGLATGALIAVYTVWDSAAVTVGGLPVVGMYWGSVVFQLLLMTPFGLRERSLVARTIRQHGLLILVVGVLAPLGYILILLAVQMAPLSLVAPAREVSVILVGLAGWLFFREPHPLQRLVGAAVLLAGVAMLAGG